MVTHASIPVCELCPLGKYKPRNGDSFQHCLPCGPVTTTGTNSDSTEDRITCNCNIVVVKELHVDAGGGAGDNEEGFYHFDILNGSCRYVLKNEAIYFNDKLYSKNISSKLLFIFYCLLFFVFCFLFLFFSIYKYKCLSI